MKKETKTIFHIDLNAFFINCEIIKNPTLKDKPVIVGGRSNAVRGVVSTASYEARKYGIHSSMPIVRARQLCPNLICLPVDMDLYQRKSQQFFAVLKQYSEKIEIASVDECYLDVSHLVNLENADKLANQIQQVVLKRTNLPCSIGIAHNRFLAKMASDLKKPLGISVINYDNLKSQLWTLDISKFHGLGKKTVPKLRNVGVNNIGDIVNNPKPDLVKSVLGNQYQNVLTRCLGNSSDIIEPDRYSDERSISNENTFRDDLYDEEIISRQFLNLTERVLKRINDKSLLVKTIAIKIRYDNFSTKIKSFTFKYHTNDFNEIGKVIINLFEETWNGNPVRLIGVSFSNFMARSDFSEQLNLFSFQNHQEDEKLIRTMNKINQKFGENSIMKGLKNEKYKK